MRKPVGITSAYADGTAAGRGRVVTFALCDDGSFWVLEAGEWKERAPIPGTDAVVAWEEDKAKLRAENATRVAEADKQPPG
jgi:hypothetical protein